MNFKTLFIILLLFCPFNVTAASPDGTVAFNSQTEIPVERNRMNYSVTEDATTRDIALQKSRISAVRMAMLDIKGEQFLRDHIRDVRSGVILKADDFIADDKVLMVIDDLNGRVKVTSDVAIDKEKLSKALEKIESRSAGNYTASDYSVPDAPKTESNVQAESFPMIEWLSGSVLFYILTVLIIVIAAKSARPRAASGAQDSVPNRNLKNVSESSVAGHSEDSSPHNVFRPRSDSDSHTGPAPAADSHTDTGSAVWNEIPASEMESLLRDTEPTSPRQFQDAMMPSSIVSYVFFLARVSGSPTGSLSLDEIFARGNKAWICKCCETMNSSEHSECIACGRER